MRAPVAERYVLRQNRSGSYLSLNNQTQSIEGSPMSMRHGAFTAMREQSAMPC